VAAEATARRAGPELFAQYTVSELARQSGLQLWGMCRAPRGVRYTP